MRQHVRKQIGLLVSQVARVGALVCLLPLLVMSCGGSSDSRDAFAAAVERGERRQPLSAAATVDASGVIDPLDLANQLMDFAERRYPEYFPGGSRNQYFDPYIYRHYAQTGTYLGVTDGAVYVMGGPFGTRPLFVDRIERFIEIKNSITSGRYTAGRLAVAARSDVTLYWDCNGNWTIDADEPRSRAGSDGNYALPNAPRDGCQLRGLTSIATRVAGSSPLPRPFVLSSMAGRPYVISPLTTLVALTGRAPADMEAALSLARGSVEVPELLSESDQAAATRVAVAIADQLQLRAWQIQAGKTLLAGEEILRDTAALVAAASSAPSSRATAVESKPRRPLAGSTADWLRTLDLPSPDTPFFGTVELPPDAVANRWTVSPGSQLTATQAEFVAEVAQVLNAAKVPGVASTQAAQHLAWTRLNNATLRDLATRASSENGAFPRDSNLLALRAGWIALRTRIDLDVQERTASSDRWAYLSVRKETAKFLFDIGINSLQAAISAAELNTGISIDTNDLVGDLRGLPQDKNWMRIVNQVTALKDLKDFIGGPRCLIELTSAVTSDTARETTAATAKALFSCMQALSNSENLVRLGELAMASGEAAILGQETYRVLAAVAKVGATYFRGRPRAFLEYVGNCLETYAIGTEYASESTELAISRADAIQAAGASLLTRADRDFHVSVLRHLVGPHLTFVFEQPISVPVSVRALGPGADTLVEFVIGAPPLVVVLPSDFQLELDFGDGRRRVVALNSTERHAYDRSGLYGATLRVRSRGVLYETNYNVMVSEIAAMKSPPRILAANFTKLQSGSAARVLVGVSDADGDAISSLRITLGSSYEDSQSCRLAAGPVGVGWHELSGCADLLRNPGQRVYGRVEAEGADGAVAVRYEFQALVADAGSSGVGVPTLSLVGIDHAGNGDVWITLEPRDAQGRSLAVELTALVEGQSVQSLAAKTLRSTPSGTTVRLGWTLAELRASVPVGRIVRFTAMVKDLDERVSAPLQGTFMRVASTTSTNQPPQVSDLRLVQDSDGSVSVSLKVFDPEGSSAGLDLYLSNAGGASFSAGDRRVTLSPAPSGALRTHTWTASQAGSLMQPGQTYAVRINAFDNRSAMTEVTSATFVRSAQTGNQPPIVSTLEATQEADGSLSVSFTANDPEGGTMGADVYLSNEGGTSYNAASRKTLAPAASGATRRVAWTKDEADSFMASGKIYAVRVDVFDSIGALTQRATDSFTRNTVAGTDELVLRERAGWGLEMRLTSVQKRGGVGRFNFSNPSCGGTLRYAGVLSATGEHVFQEDHESGNCAKDCDIRVAADLRSFREVCPSPPHNGATTHTASFEPHGYSPNQLLAAVRRAEGPTPYGLVESIVNGVWQYPPMSGADFKAGIQASTAGVWAVGLRLGLADFDGIRVLFELPSECRGLEISFFTRDTGYPADVAPTMVFADMAMGMNQSHSGTPTPMAAGRYMLALRRLSSSSMGWTLHDTQQNLLLESGTMPSNGLAASYNNGEINIQGFRGACAIRGARVTDWSDATFF